MSNEIELLTAPCGHEVARERPYCDVCAVAFIERRFGGLRPMGGYEVAGLAGGFAMSMTGGRISVYVAHADLMAGASSGVFDVWVGASAGGGQSIAPLDIDVEPDFIYAPAGSVALEVATDPEIHYLQAQVLADLVDDLLRWMRPLEHVAHAPAIYDRILDAANASDVLRMYAVVAFLLAIQWLMHELDEEDRAEGGPGFAHTTPWAK